MSSFEDLVIRSEWVVYDDPAIDDTCVYIYIYIMFAAFNHEAMDAHSAEVK
jgi:hypothetical protein